MKQILQKCRIRFLASFFAIIMLLSLVNNEPIYAAESYDGYLGIANSSNITVWEDYNGTKKIGTIYARESFTILNNYGSTKYVEYSTPKGPKRGYLIWGNFNEIQINSTWVAKVNSGGSVYYGPNTVRYASAGSVSKGEIVVALGSANGWTYIEYNVYDGTRKRGYIQSSKLTMYNQGNKNKGLSINMMNPNGINVKNVTNTTYIYAGPSSMYPIIGSVSAIDGNIPHTSMESYGEGIYYYVEYTITATGQKKTGYLKQ